EAAGQYLAVGAKDVGRPGPHSETRGPDRAGQPVQCGLHLVALVVAHSQDGHRLLTPSPSPRHVPRYAHSSGRCGPEETVDTVPPPWLWGTPQSGSPDTGCPPGSRCCGRLPPRVNTPESRPPVRRPSPPPPGGRSASPS